MPSYELELSKLYEQQSLLAGDVYLQAHSRNKALLRRQISIFQRCEEYFKNARVVLDWGCRHASESCMVRMLLGRDVELHGCDVDPPGYRAFYDYADLKYEQLTHAYELPYLDNQFDAVIGSGVLEHVPNDSESLKELYRVIRPGGHLIVTFLPNRYSYTEWLNRTLRYPHHLRRYRASEIKYMFMHHGFRPIRYGYHQMFPSLSSPRGGIFNAPLANKFVERLAVLNGTLERVPPLNFISTNIFMVGQKVQAFHG